MTSAATLPREWVHGPQWLSEQAREEWAPILTAAQAAWRELEALSITEGIRGSALVHLTADEVPQAASDCAMVGLELSVLSFNGTMFRAAAHVPGQAADWHRAWAAGDDDAIGALLAFPECCRAFFARTWGAGSYDPTPSMETVDGPWPGNILLRWLGVRLVPHMPCSGSCAATVAQAEAYLAAGRRVGLDVGAIEKLLRLPVTYSAVNGVAIIETPHFRFQASADPGPLEVRRVRRAQDVVPSVEPGADLQRDQAPDGGWKDNGFSSEPAMSMAHRVLLAAVAECDAGRAGGYCSNVLDLGCGDGALLDKIRQRFTGTSCAGVEVDFQRVLRGRLRHPLVQIEHGAIESVGVDALQALTPDAPSLVLLMPGRLLEMTEADAARVRRALKGLRLLLYVYSDWSGLQKLAAAVGLEVTGRLHVGPGVAAAEGRVSA